MSEEAKPIKFTLGEKQLRFQYGNINLNRFEGNVNGEVQPEDPEYRTVLISIQRGVLIPTKHSPRDRAPVPETVDLSSVQDDKAAITSKAMDILKRLQKEDLLENISTTKNPVLIVAMIELESKGKNVSKRKRDDVIAALNKRLETLKKAAKTSLTEEPETK